MPRSRALRSIATEGSGGLPQRRDLRGEGALRAIDPSGVGLRRERAALLTAQEVADALRVRPAGVRHASEDAPPVEPS